MVGKMKKDYMKYDSSYPEMRDKDYFEEFTKIGIIGRGFVGSAVEFGFSAQTGCDAKVRIYDVDSTKSLNSLMETVNESKFIFLSVPTPAKEDGSVCLDIVYEAVESIDKCNERSDNVILLRSTVVPGTTRKLQDKFSKLNIIFNPEFLTERSAKYDFINQSRFIIGGSGKAANHSAKEVSKLFQWRFGESVPIILTNYETAELIKYMNNCFFATKVSFLNEMKLIADKCGVDWEMADVNLNERINQHHELYQKLGPPTNGLESGSPEDYGEKPFIYVRDKNKIKTRRMTDEEYGYYKNRKFYTESYAMDSNSYDAGVDPKDYDPIQKQAYNEMSSDGLPPGGDAQAVRESHRLAEEIVDTTDKKYIYESPDGGKTIYRRGLGEDKRELVKDWPAEKKRIEDNWKKERKVKK